MNTDLIPLPSKGLFYNKNKYDEFNEYIEVGYLTTEDEIALTSTNIFHKGDVLYRLVKNKIEPYNDWITVDELLFYDYEYILLWLRETAYGNILEETVNEKTYFYFNTHDINISFLDLEPINNMYEYNINGDLFKIKPITTFDYRKYKLNPNKIEYYYAHIISINDNTDTSYIKTFIEFMSPLNSRKLKSFINNINYGINKNTFYFENGEKKSVYLNIDEKFFGLEQDTLQKTNEMLNNSIFFLMNEGQGYTNNDILKMPTHIRIFNIHKLSEKIERINKEMEK